MDDRRVADYFVVAGLPSHPQPLEEFTNEAAIKPTYKQDPITDITIINKSLGEKVPRGYVCLDKTPTDYPADLNHGSIRCHEMYVCYRRSRDKPALTDVGVLYEGKERLMAGCEVVHTTYFGNPANVNNSNSMRIYVTYRRASENAPSDMLAVVDLCIILENKGESPPHSYNQINKNINRGLVGSDVYLCYKKAMTKTDILAYKPAILDRYPKEDYEDFPLPESVSMFCLPMGATVECWSAKAQHPYPVFSTFILTGIGWQKVYGAAITFYEEFPEEKLTDLQMRHLGLKNKHIREQYRIMKTVHYNKSVCLLSHWPFFDAFRKLLTYLYRISITGPHTVPIERHISHFMYDVPYPSPQRPRILVQLSHDSLSLSMPEDSPLPQSGASFVTMLKNLGPENCMTILLYVLHEYKILIHSLRPAVLTSVAEAVSTLIFPLQWQCPYIPLCPLGLSVVLSAPTPYIIGLDSRYFDLFDPPPDVICIDLDTIRIWPPDDKKNASYKSLPKKPTKVLQETLHALYDRLSQELPRHTQDEITLDTTPIDMDFKRKHKEMMLELQIQEAFLRFMACLMKGYKQFLKPIENAPNIDTTNAASLFDMTAFLKSRDKANHKFFNTLLRTQLFNRFIEERSFVSDKDASLAFFDECTEKVEEIKDEPKLIELDDSSKSERTMFILPPEPVGLPENVTYSYNGFPTLNPDLFLETKKASLASKGVTPACHNSPVARRTKQEMKTAQKMAQQFLGQPVLWAKCLLSHCYSLWFMMLPAYIKHCQSVTRALRVAYDVLKNMQREKLKPPDELCYRVMLQLCGQYNQPVLAVKVYSEMKRAGVQPNAITYGYYNKAVLEGKWPSSISKGRKLWRKLRNVVLGVAKFRKAIRRRSLSVYSNSGSEYDQVSHASIDSFLEDAQVDGATTGKHECIMKTDGRVEGRLVETVVNGSQSKCGKIPEELERTPSDRGYNSMTLEEAKNFSEIIGSETNKNSSSEPKPKKDAKNTLKWSFKRSKRNSDVIEEKATDSDNDSAFKGQDTSTQEEFRSRMGSIVRHCSVGSGHGSHETLRSSMLGSSAGLLMVSESLVSGSLSQSMGPAIGRSAANDMKRKRHKSAGDPYNTKTRSNSLFANWRLRNVSNEEMVGMKFSDLIAKEETDGLLVNSGHDLDGQVGTEMQDISEEIKDSGVALDENEVGGVCTACVEGGETVHGNETSVGDVHLGVKARVGKNAGALRLDTGQGEQGLTSGMGEGRVDLIDTLTIKSNTSSPVHSMPTPVTENDPLGLFIDGSTPVAAPKHTPKTSPVKLREKFVSTTPFQAERSSKNLDSMGMCNKSTASSANEESTTNRVDNSGDGTVARVTSPVEKVQKHFLKMERTSSFPENLGNAIKTSVRNSWKEKRERSDSQTETTSLGRSSVSLNEAKTDGTPRSGLFRTGSFRRHKENFSGMLKFATGAVANKLTEIKLSMTPGKIGSSNSSLTASYDEGDSDDERNYLQSAARKKVNMDYHRSDDRLEQSGGYNGTAPVPESAPNHRSFMDQMDRLCAAEAREEAEQGAGHVKFLVDAGAGQQEIAIEVEMCSCSRCPRCHCLLYDEEIMAGWNADDSNLNTSCQFCNTKLVPHLLIYLKDHRWKKKSKLLDTEEDSENLMDMELPETVNKSPLITSYGKDASFCPHESTAANHDAQLLFGEDLEEENCSVKGLDTSSHDPWTLRQPEETSEAAESVQGLPVPATPERRQSDSLSLSEMAYAGRHRRTASECLTSATENMYSSSLDSLESFTFRNTALRSPLSISIDESEPLPTQPSHLPQTKRAMFDRGLSPLDPISVPYLSPLVLRKNLETIIESEGNSSLAKDTFVDEHPIIFWNMVWFFKRIQAFSYLPGLLLTAKSYNPQNEHATATDMSSAHLGSENVLVRPMWDNIRIHEEVGLPMHIAWNKTRSSTTVDALITESQPFNRAVMHQIITNIQCNDVLSPIKLVMNGRRRLRPRRKRFRSMYREVLYLSFIACGRENIDPDAFDREYKLAFTRLSGGEIKRLQRDDKPRSQTIQQCRKVFADLEV